MGLHLDSALPHSSALLQSAPFIAIMHRAPTPAQKMAPARRHKCQRQSSSGRHTEQVCNKHIPAFIGSKVTWIHGAHEVDHLCKAFERKRATEGGSCPHEPQDDINLQDCKHMPEETEDQARPECGRGYATKREEVVFSRIYG